MDDCQKRQHPKVQQAIRDAVALNNAVTFCSRKGASDIEAILGIADSFREWLNTVSESKETSIEKPPTGSGVVYPTPTLEQKKVLDEIVKRSGKTVDEVYPKVLDWVKKTYDADQYPQLMTSVSQFLEWVGWS